MTTAAKILIVDDETAIRRLLRGTLIRAGYDVVEAADGRAALSALAIDKPDLVLLDLGLPDRDGLELVPLLKRQAALIVVSARDQTGEKVAALDLGADDFITKPFDTDELLARVRTSLRHRLASEADAPIVAFGAVTIDLVARQVRRDAVELRLTPKEYGFLAELAKHPGRVLTHHQLLRAVWGPAHLDDVEYLRVVVRSLRQKLSPDGMALIRNEPGVGYRLMTTG
jgi:two-component system KDP operon response regulator KdpE